MKLIAGSVYMIRADLLKKYGWGKSITEDFELTLRLYADGYKVIYSPYIQTPSECVSTIKRLVRQRMRWAEGHTHNIRKMFWKIMKSPYINIREKLEFLYLCPYYLQAAFFLFGTLCWFISDAILRTPLPFWTSLWGWCLVLTNLFALPLMNSVGLFLEESPKRDYLGIFSFMLMCYIVVPFQAYAALKGLFEKEEGHWFRTPKSGVITDVFSRFHFSRLFDALFPGRRRREAAYKASEVEIDYLKPTTANNQFNNFGIKKRKLRWLPKTLLIILITIAVNLIVFARNVPQALATNPTAFYLSNNTSNVITSVQAWQLLAAADADNSTNTQFGSASFNGSVNFRPGATYSTVGTPGTPTNYGWIYDTPFGTGGSIAAGTWTFYYDEIDTNANFICYMRVLVFKVQISGGAIAAGWTNILDATNTADFCDGAESTRNFTAVTGAQTNFTTGDYLYIEYWGVYTKYKSTSAQVNFHTGPSHNNPRVIPPTVQVPEYTLMLLAIIPFLPFLVKKLQARRTRRK